MIKVLKDNWGIFKGVMFKKLKQEDIYIFIFSKPHKQFFIHTFFCKQSLYIYFLDRNFLLLYKNYIKTWKFRYFELPTAVKYIIESPTFLDNQNLNEIISLI